MVRVRPEISEDADVLLPEDNVSCVQHDDNSITLSRPYYAPKNFRYDHVVGPVSNQETAYDIIAKDAVREAMDGFNSTVMCYGQVTLPTRPLCVRWTGRQ